ncbi:unnamed protein product [Absidia cylindrospora]
MVFRKGGKWVKKVHKKSNTQIEKDKEHKAFVLENEDFETYYKTPLASTFRITGTKNNALQIRQFIENHHVVNMQNVVVDGVKYDAPSPDSWYPDQLCYEITCPRKVLRYSPEYAAFQKFLVAENEVGNITRQELVSMVPPLLMDIHPHHHVLDMCAAPGSKTGQIVEAVHANDKLEELPTGLVIANDADYKRSQLLVHQLKRLQSPCFMATNHDAAHFPNIYISKNGVDTLLQFDRVLCDVPCSGDGTVRKNPKVWKEWTQGIALSLHTIQVQIFLRGAQLVKMGGRIVYSTCSFNPVENEAVVAQVLRLSKGALELKDVSDQLPDLIRRPGLTTWKVMTRENQFISSVDDIENARARRKFPKSALPPENADSLHLDRCLRIYPHDQNTGGFFVAVFEKVKPMTLADRRSVSKDLETSCHATDIQAGEVEDEALVESVAEAISNAPLFQNPETPDDQNEQKTETAAPVANAVKTAKKDVYGMKEAPFDMMSPESRDLSEIKSFFGLDSSFPMDQFLLRSDMDTKNRQIYFVSQAAKSVLESKQVKRLHIVNTGVRLFSRQGTLADTTECAFRISSEGVPLLQQYISDHRSVHIGLDDLKVLLATALPKIPQFTAETQARLNKLSLGGVLFVVDVSKAHLPEGTNMMLSVWRGITSVNVLLNKHEKKSMCQRLFGIIPEPTPVNIKDKHQSIQGDENEENGSATLDDESQ